ncbi:MAG: metallophosphoesterase [Bacteroidia bacterium]|nr:metallophosphoesterase [Bacteroidia bacterium]
MSFLIRAVLIIGVLVLIDLYAFQAVKTLTADFAWKGYVKWGYWSLHILFYLATFTFFLLYESEVKLPDVAFHFLVTPLAILYIPKFPLIAFLLGEDIFRVGAWIYHKISWLIHPPEPVVQAAGAGISRTKFISQAATVVAALPFAGLVWGAVAGRYNFKVFRHRLAIPGLPEEMEGLTITQLSDLHCGSFFDKEAVKEGIDLANAQNSDLMIFTGDLVNMRASEVDGWEEIFGSLRAPLGVYSILGNHDYGDYVRDWTEGEKEANLRDLIARQKDLGWDLMLNENRILNIKGKKLALIGVENTSGTRGFHSYGDLPKAYKGTEQADLKLLLSHDPSHWEAEVVKDFPDIAATFSGHTHGFQMGIEIPGFIKWSPVQYVYKQWAGMYEKGAQKLYVNRGFGFHAYRGRAGIRPEITVFTLERA